MQGESSERPRPTDVYFFATCLVDLFCPEAGIDAITLIEREGITVHFPENQTCCGQPAYTSGFADQARAVALTQMQLFPNDWPVVVPVSYTHLDVYKRQDHETLSPYFCRPSRRYCGARPGLRVEG